MYPSPIRCRTGQVVTRDGFVFCDVVATERDHDYAPALTPVQPDRSAIPSDVPR
jgi:hypothetical protein